MKKTKTRIARILAAMLCICIMCPCMTAFAMADDANVGIEPPVVTTEPETEPDKESEDTEAEANTIIFMPQPTVALRLTGWWESTERGCSVSSITER